MSEAERRRFLANAAADADRLSHLLRRLLDLARADMAVAPRMRRPTWPGRPLTRGRRAARRGFRRHRRRRREPAQVAAPAELIETVLETLVENSRQAGAQRGPHRRPRATASA